MDEKTLYYLTIMLIAVLQALMPFISRKDQCFGVAIPPSQYKMDKLVNIKWAYVISCIMISAVPIAYISKNRMNEIGFIAVMIFTLAGYAMIYYIYNKKVVDIKNQEEWQTDKPSKNTPKDVIPKDSVNLKMWFGIYAIIFVLTVALTAVTYPNMPEQIAMHYSFNGTAGNFTDKSIVVAMFPAVMQLFLIGIFGINILIKSKQIVDNSNIEESTKSNYTFRRVWILFFLFSGVATMVLPIFIILMFSNMLDVTIFNIYILIYVIFIISSSAYLSIKYGQSGNRIYKSSSTKISSNENGQNWMMGIIYINKNDPSMFVEKRFGIGWTMNLANPKAILLLAVILLMTICFVTYSINL